MELIVGAMISIGKLTAGSADYYLDQVAGGAEDYYFGRGEAPGRWLADGPGLGLSGEVAPEALRALLEGRHPHTGEVLVSHGGGSWKVTAFDLTASAPKGVSLLAALGPPDIAAATRAAHDHAVVETVAYLGDWAVGVRRGHAGAEAMGGQGVVAAGFRHRTSRAGDPQLHTHVLVANLTRGGDGRVSALDGRLVYGQLRAAGYVYRAALRAGLSERLGLAWGEVVDGMAEPEGFTRRQLDAFSTRRAEIEARLAVTGGHSWRAREVAALGTRSAKSEVDPDTLAAEWRSRAAELGITSESLRELTGPARPTGLSAAEREELFEELAGPDGLTAHASAFERRDVVRAVAGAARAGISRPGLEAEVEAFCSREDLVTLAPGRLGQSRFTTIELLATEAEVLAVAEIRSGRDTSLPPAVVGRILKERPELSEDQRAMVRHITTGAAGVVIAVGKAGTGKTFALDAARAAWESEGVRVVGAALAARAAGELAAGSGIESTTLAGLLADLSRPEGRLPRRSVIVLDEAGLVGTRDLARLMSLAPTSRLVLVGDPRQLPEIGAGGTFAALVARLGAAHLEVNRRQVEAWERNALDSLRSGSVAQAVDAYQRAGRITLSSTAADARRLLVADWAASITDGESSVMIALRRDDVAGLNRLARAAMADAGRVDVGREVTYGEVRFAVGDVVVATRNDRRQRLFNGLRGTVRAVAPEGLWIATPSGQDRAVRADYIQAGHLQYGYALTAHRAQGATYQRAFLLGDESLYREAGYVGMSRARLQSNLYVVGTGVELTTPQSGLLADLTRRLSVSRAQAMALAGPATLADLAAERTALHRRLLTEAPAPVDQSVLADAEADVARLRLAVSDPGSALRTAAPLEQAEERLARLFGQRDHREAWGEAEAARLTRLALLDAAMARRQADMEAEALAAPAPWLTELIGPVPTGLSDRSNWARTAGEVLAYRERNGVTDEGLGVPPRDLRARIERDRVEAAVDGLAHSLGRAPVFEASKGISR